MNFFLIQAILIAGIGDEESNGWAQILVFLLLGFLGLLYSLIKKHRTKYKDQRHNFAKETSSHYAKSRWRLQLPHKRIGLRKGMVQKYVARMRDTRHHITNLLQKPILDFDNLDTAGRENLKNELHIQKNKDLHSGMELLELDFLLSIVENTKGNGQNDVIMRKLNFNELFRVQKLNQVNSKALQFYAINRDNLYGKDIQCQAMSELAERTIKNVFS